MTILRHGRGQASERPRPGGSAPEGFTVGLISRNQSRLDALADEFGMRRASRAQGRGRRPGPGVAGRSHSSRWARSSGPIEVLQYSPLPAKEFMRPVLETTPADLVGPVEFSIYGSVAAVHQVLPGMRLPRQGPRHHPVRQRRIRRHARPQRHRHVRRVRRTGRLRPAAARGARRGGHPGLATDHPGRDRGTATPRRTPRYSRRTSGDLHTKRDSLPLPGQRGLTPHPGAGPGENGPEREATPRLPDSRVRKEATWHTLPLRSTPTRSV